MKKNELLNVMAQAFYGNRTCTRIKEEDMDHFILGYLDCTLNVTELIDRSIIKVPRTDNVVLVYNKYQEDEKRAYAEELKDEKGYVLKPLAVIPELDLELYSRCIVCRMNEAGEFESLCEEDFEKFIDYMAE